MAAHQSVLRISKSIAGAILLIFGMFVLYEHLAAAVARLSHVLANGSAALGVLPAVALAVSQAVHAYGFDCHRFLQGLSQQMLISSWPLLLVIFGTVLSRDSFTDKSSGQD
jgi:putative Mn2+ efflux pump MntP